MALLASGPTAEPFNTAVMLISSMQATMTSGMTMRNGQPGPPAKITMTASANATAAVLASHVW